MMMTMIMTGTIPVYIHLRNLGVEVQDDQSRDGWTVDLVLDMITIGTTEDETHGITGWKRIVHVAFISQ